MQKICRRRMEKNLTCCAAGNFHIGLFGCRRLGSLEVREMTRTISNPPTTSTNNQPNHQPTNLSINQPTNQPTNQTNKQTNNVKKQNQKQWPTLFTVCFCGNPHRQTLHHRQLLAVGVECDCL